MPFGVTIFGIIALVCVGLMLLSGILIPLGVSGREENEMPKPITWVGIGLLDIGFIGCFIFGILWMCANSNVKSESYYAPTYNVEQMYSDLKDKGIKVDYYEISEEKKTKLVKNEYKGQVAYEYYNACITCTPTPIPDLDFEKYKETK